MNKRVLPNEQASLNAAANNGEINYFITPPELADYYFAKITNANIAGFRGQLLDYYIEATDTKGNLHKSEIQHVFVEDDGAVTDPPATPNVPEATANSSTEIALSWAAINDANGYRVLRDNLQIAEVSGTSYTDSGLTPETSYSYRLIAFNNAGSSGTSTATVITTPAPPAPPAAPDGLSASALSHTTAELSWNASVGATAYLATNEGGDSPATDAVTITTPSAPPSFELGSAEDPSGYLVDDPGMRIFAAIRGTLLYVGTWTPSGGPNDHFIFVTDSVEATASTAAPWSKAGTTAVLAGKPYLGAEADNDYIGWFHTSGSSQAWRSPTSGGRMEGVIDLVEVFGQMPESVHLAAVAYQTDSNGILAAQAPEGNGDNKLDPNELMEFPTATLIDSVGSGTFDRLDPGRAFRIRSLMPGHAANELTVPIVPGQAYRVLSSSTLAPDSWTELTSFTAQHGDDEVIIEDTIHAGEPKRFYRIEAE